ncbi:MAG: hypothetical protein V2A78_04295 [bacterium]
MKINPPAKDRITREKRVKKFALWCFLFAVLALSGCNQPEQPPVFQNCFSGCPTYVVTTEEPTIITDVCPWGSDFTLFKHVPIEGAAGHSGSFDKANVIYLIDRSKLEAGDVSPDLEAGMPSIPCGENQVLVSWRQRPRADKRLKYFDILISSPRQKFLREEVANLWNRLKDREIKTVKDPDFYLRETSLAVVFTNDRTALPVFFKDSPDMDYEVCDIEEYSNLKDQIEDQEEIYIINNDLRLPKNFLPKDLLSHLPEDIWKSRETTQLVMQEDKGAGKSLIALLAPNSDCLKNLAARFTRGKVEKYAGDVPDLRKWKKIITVIFDSGKTPEISEGFVSELSNGFSPELQEYFLTVNAFFRDEYARKLMLDVFMNRADPGKLVELQTKASGDSFFFGQITGYSAQTDYRWTIDRLTPGIGDFEFTDGEPMPPPEPRRNDWEGIFNARAKYGTDEDFRRAHDHWKKDEYPSYEREHRNWQHRKDRAKKDYEDQRRRRRIDWDCKLIQTPSIHIGLTCAFVRDGVTIWSRNFYTDIKDDLVFKSKIEFTSGEDSSPPGLETPVRENHVPPEYLSRVRDELVRQFREKIKSEVLLPRP